MSATLITDSFLREWRLRQLRVQTLECTEYRPVRLPVPNPAPEEFADAVYNCVQLVTNHRFDARESRRSWVLHGTSLYNYVSLEAMRLEIPQEELWPVASFSHPVAYIDGICTDLQAVLSNARLYIISRPPAYMSRLASLELPTSSSTRSQYGRSTTEPLIVGTPILPPSWHDVPLFMSANAGHNQVWNRLCVFRPSDFASIEEAEAHLPNNQPHDFYDRALTAPATPYIQTRNSCYSYAPSIRPATALETEAWLAQFTVGMHYQFAGIDLYETLVQRIGANARALLADQAPRPRAEDLQAVSVTPGVATDVQPPPGSPSTRTTRNNPSFQTLRMGSVAASQRGGRTSAQQRMRDAGFSPLPGQPVMAENAAAEAAIEGDPQRVDTIFEAAERVAAARAASFRAQVMQTAQYAHTMPATHPMPTTLP